MASRSRGKQRWYGYPQAAAAAAVPPLTLTPLMEEPDLYNMQDEGEEGSKRSETSWEVIREWFRMQKNLPAGGGGGGAANKSSSLYGRNNINIPAAAATAKRPEDLRFLLGVLGCPLAPIPLINNINPNNIPPNPPHIKIKEIPLETSAAHYIIQQYLAATGCLRQEKPKKNMYTAGMVKMMCCETEISSGKGSAVKTLGTKCQLQNGCFVMWQMSPGMWSLELVVGGNKVLAGSDGKIVWRHTPWLGTHAAKGPQRPLRRIIQGLDPKSTAALFAKAQCLGEKRIGEDDCFVLKVAADRCAVMERSEGPAEVIRHVLYGYFSQKSGLLIYLEDSHLTRVLVQVVNQQHREEEEYSSYSSSSSSSSSPADDHHANYDSNNDMYSAASNYNYNYWETTIGSSIGDYRDVDGVLIAHQGRTVATIFRFGETSLQYSRTRMEEVWGIHDVVFDVPGLSHDSFIPPADIYDHATSI